MMTTLAAMFGAVPLVRDHLHACQLLPVYEEYLTSSSHPAYLVHASCRRHLGQAAISSG
jgi:hypothetical protein